MPPGDTVLIPGDAMRKLIAEHDADGAALDRIAAVLDGAGWSPGTLEAIAEIVRGTGREIRDVI